jgi:hypothetical protein
VRHVRCLASVQRWPACSQWLGEGGKRSRAAKTLSYAASCFATFRALKSCLRWVLCVWCLRTAGWVALVVVFLERASGGEEPAWQGTLPSYVCPYSCFPRSALTSLVFIAVLCPFALQSAPLIRIPSVAFILVTQYLSLLPQFRRSHPHPRRLLRPSRSATFRCNRPRSRGFPCKQPVFPSPCQLVVQC